MEILLGEWSVLLPPLIQQCIFCVNVFPPDICSYWAIIGQVESAFEFARICRKFDYHNFVFSMKASNPVIMVQAYRLLVAEMYVQGWDYPLHLGVTEAGEGEDGRMKSAIGIGTLLQVCMLTNCIKNGKFSISIKNGNIHPAV